MTGRMGRASLPEAGEPPAPCALAPGRNSGGVLRWAEVVPSLAAVSISRRAWFPRWFQANGVLAHRIVVTWTRCHRGISIRVEVERVNETGTGGNSSVLEERGEGAGSEPKASSRRMRKVLDEHFRSSGSCGCSVWDGGSEQLLPMAIVGDGAGIASAAAGEDDCTAAA